MNKEIFKINYNSQNHLNEMINNKCFKNLVKTFIKNKKFNLKTIKTLKNKYDNKAKIEKCNICFDNNTNLLLFCCCNNICQLCDNNIKNRKYECPFCRKKNYKTGLY
jgi:hypothetical protein